MRYSEAWREMAQAVAAVVNKYRPPEAPEIGDADLIETESGALNWWPSSGENTGWFVVVVLDPDERELCTWSYEGDDPARVGEQFVLYRDGHREYLAPGKYPDGPGPSDFARGWPELATASA